MNFNLGGKVALVTGGGRDVGREIALALAAEGAAVALNYSSSADAANAVVKEIEANGGKAKAYKADISDYEAVKAMVAGTVKDLGRLDILVNNAGLAKRNRFVDTTPAEWKKHIDVNLYGMIHCCHAAAPHIQSKSGRIIGVIGDSSRVGESGLSLVAAARAGVIGLVKSLAKELGRFGTTANVVSLGMVETAHDKEFLDANREKLVKFYPVRRLGQPADVAPTVTLLASEQAGWITGQVISISGGFCMV